MTKTHRKTRDIPVVHLFPPSSPLFSSLFVRMNACAESVKSQLLSAQSSSSLSAAGLGEELQWAPDKGPSPNDVLPSNEVLVEALGNVWLRMHSGGVYSKGVLLLSTHRVMFIHYPSDRDAGFTSLIPLSRIPTVSIRRRWKDKYNTLALLCKDQIAYLFVTMRDENEVRTLEAFRRIKSEIKWRREEDNFCSTLDPLVVSEHFVRLVEEADSSPGGLGNPMISPSSSANDFSSTNLVSRGVNKEVAAAAAVGMGHNHGMGMGVDHTEPMDAKEAEIATPFDMFAEFDR
jgi:hypothetical protein